MSMSSRHNDEFCKLVNLLMNAGWYRVSQDLTRADRQWGFRQGHTLDVPAQECWVVANSEIEAMRIMWNIVSTQRVEKHLGCRKPREDQPASSRI